MMRINILNYDPCNLCFYCSMILRYKTGVIIINWSACFFFMLLEVRHKLLKRPRLDYKINVNVSSKKIIETTMYYFWWMNMVNHFLWHNCSRLSYIIVWWIILEATFISTKSTILIYNPQYIHYLEQKDKVRTTTEMYIKLVQIRRKFEPHNNPFLK